MGFRTESDEGDSGEWRASTAVHDANSWPADDGGAVGDGSDFDVQFSRNVGRGL